MNDTAELFIDSRCALGEGSFWHPLVERLFWFDIINKALYSATAGGIMVDRFSFETSVSAAGIIDAENLAIASSEGIYKLNIRTDTRELLVPLEADMPGNRSNDGRVNPAGGFWIGTMATEDPVGKASGGLYQVRGGQVTKLLSGIRVPNATCFSPDGTRAYFTDGVTRVIRTVPIDRETGLPNGEWTEFATAKAPIEPDGAVVDSAGYVWNAQWNGGTVTRYAPDGSVDRVITIPASRPTCPAFGGPDLKTLYVTSARTEITDEQLKTQPHAGGVFSIRVEVPGMPESLFRA